MSSFLTKENKMIRILILMLFVLSITACEKEDNNVAIPIEETSNEGDE